MALPDFANLTVAEQEALTGPEREAWYAYQRGNEDKVAEIAKAYEFPEPVIASEPEPPATPDVETAVEDPPAEQAVKPKATRGRK